MASSSSMLSSSFPHTPSRIVVGDGTTFATTHTSHTTIPTSASPISLRNVLVSPHLIRNLISVKALARDNHLNVEFDDFGFSVKDRRTKRVILRCNSDDDELYPMSSAPASRDHHALTATTRDLWHQRLGHLGGDALGRTLRLTGVDCDHSAPGVCHACQLGKSTRLPFSSSGHVSFFPFQLVHCDVWTSPVQSNSGCQYYLLISTYPR